MRLIIIKNKTKKIKRKKYKCPFCSRVLPNPSVICICEITPKHNYDYVEWRRDKLGI